MTVVINGTSGITDVNGTAAAPAITGTDTDTGIYFGTNTVSFATNGAAVGTFDASGNLGIGVTSPNVPLHITKTGIDSAVGFYSIAKILDGSGNKGLQVGYDNSTQTTTLVASTTSAQSSLAFWTYGSSWAERARITNGGDLLIGTNGASPLNTGRVRATTAGQDVFKAYQTGNPYTCYWGRIDSTSSYFAYWDYNGSPVGSINTNGTSTAYNTSSDYRLKENIAPMTGALDVVSQLKPVTYTWKANGSNGQGFIAHELAEVVPDCVTGEKDAVETYTDVDGNEQTRPKYQGIDVSFLVATLTAAIQELKAEFDAYKAAHP